MHGMGLRLCTFRESRPEQGNALACVCCLRQSVTQDCITDPHGRHEVLPFPAKLQPPAFEQITSLFVQGEGAESHADSLQDGRAVTLQLQCSKCKSNARVITWPCWLDAAS